MVVWHVFFSKHQGSKWIWPERQRIRQAQSPTGPGFLWIFDMPMVRKRDDCCCFGWKLCNLIDNICCSNFNHLDVEGCDETDETSWKIMKDMLLGNYEAPHFSRAWHAVFWMNHHSEIQLDSGCRSLVMTDILQQLIGIYHRDQSVLHRCCKILVYFSHQTYNDMSCLTILLAPGRFGPMTSFIERSSRTDRRWFASFICSEQFIVQWLGLAASSSSVFCPSSEVCVTFQIEGILLFPVSDRMDEASLPLTKPAITINAVSLYWLTVY